MLVILFEIGIRYRIPIWLAFNDSELRRCSTMICERVRLDPVLQAGRFRRQAKARTRNAMSAVNA